MWRLGEEKDELMPIGFEVAFPSLIDIAKGLGLEVPYDDPALKKIYAKRNLKLKRYSFIHGRNLYSPSRIIFLMFIWLKWSSYEGDI